jgi:two-component system, cell cycle sensor histidine kinase and response regulator CckA
MKETIRLLYAEDNPIDADLTRSYFADHAPEFEIEIVGTGQGCLERLSETGFDLLLLDHHLPDMDGLDVLRTLYAGMQIPAVLVTGIGDEDLVIRALRLGAANYVSKQGNYLETLPDLVRGVIADHRLKKSIGLPATSPRRILFVEHQSMDIELTLRHFAEAAPNFTVDVVFTCASALTRLEHPHNYDLTLVDLRMPDQSGLDFIREAKRRLLPLPPFIIISGKGDEIAAIATLKLGAADYIIKREGYLDHLTYAIDRAITHDRLNRLNEQLRVELSERRQTEKALQESDVRYHLLFEEAQDGIALADTETETIVDCNRALCCMTERDKIELLGQHQSILHPPQNMKNKKTSSFLLHKTMDPRQAVDDNLLSKSGRLIPVEIRAAQVSMNGRNYLFGIFRDITMRKRAEEERETLEEQLRVSQKIEAIGRLAGGIAHDFNNMLSVILGYGEHLIAQLQDGDPLREEAKEIVKAGQRSALLTRQLLAFSRRQPLQPIVLDLNAVLQNIEKMLRRLISEDIELELLLSNDLARVMADQGQIEQVIMNLVVNARDAMPQGGKVIVETANVEIDERFAQDHMGIMPGKHVMLTVSDTGYGIDKETIAQIFDPFFTTKEKGKGTGLGLPTVYGIVKQSGGYIWVGSESEKGTTFKIYLPQTQEQLVIKKDRIGKKEQKGNGEQILLVEDEESFRALLKKNLSNLNFKVTAAPNGSEALRLVKENRLKPDLVITDVVMPGMSGSTLAERLRHTQPDMQVLYMSGYTDNAIVHHGVLDPGTPFIQKPFNIRELVSKIWEVLQEHLTYSRSGKSILMIDDDAQIRDLVRWFCKKGGHDFVGVDSSASAIKVLAGQPVDVMFVDMNIPGTDGKRILEEIRAAGYTTPAIVLTGDSYKVDIDALRPLGVINVLEKSGDARPFLKMIEELDIDKVV